MIPNGRTVPAAPQKSPRLLQAITAGRLWDEGKNLKLLSHIESPLPILVPGEVGYDYTYAGNRCGQASLLGRLAEDELLDLMRQSAIYIRTSIYEPFGLAPLEAALCGCAVVASDLPSLREVWGDAALYFHDSSSLTSLLEVLAADSGLRSRARARAQRRARQLSARKMAKSYLELIQTVAEPAITEYSAA